MGIAKLPIEAFLFNEACECDYKLDPVESLAL